MMRQGSPYGQYQKYFNQGATYPYARYESDDEENELDRARELYKNLQGSPGGWQTRALKGQNRNLTRRLGETDQQLRQRTQEYERRLREGEDARSLLGSQLEEARSHYDADQSRWGEEKSLYKGKMADYENHLKEKDTLYNQKMAEWHNQTSQDPLAQGYDPDYQQPNLPEYRKKFMENNVYPVAKYLMEQNALKKPELKNHPWIRGFPNYLSNEGLDPLKISDEDVWKKQQYVNERAPSEMVKKYPPYKPPNAKMTLPEYRNHQLGKIYSQHTSDLQSQMEGMSSYYDKEFSSFFKDLDTVSQGGSIPDDRSYFAPSDVGKSQASFASSIASRQSLNRVGDLYRQGRQRETELSQLRGQYNQGVQDFKRLHATFDQEKSSLTRESSQWKAKHDALLPVVQEFEINKPRLAEYPALKKFRQDYNHVNLNEYAKIPAMRQTLQNAPREAAALYKDAVDFYNSRHRNSYGKDYPGTISWGKKFGLL